MNSVSPVRTAKGVVGFLFVGEQEAELSRVWPGVASTLTRHRPDVHFGAVDHADVRKCRFRRFADVNVCAGASRQLVVAGDKVGVQVRLEDVANLEPCFFAASI